VIKIAKLVWHFYHFTASNLIKGHYVNHRHVFFAVNKVLLCDDKFPNLNVPDGNHWKCITECWWWYR